MSHPSLHSIQRQLITLLTTPDAFDPDHPGVVALGNEIGPDTRRISLYARLSHSKRVSKIEAVLPQTIVHLGEPFHPLGRPFLATYPPTGASRYDNARQFFEFLVRRWRGRPDTRPYLLDLARYELAVAEARNQPWRSTGSVLRDLEKSSRIRRSPGLVIIRCKYDVRPLLVRDEAEPPPPDPATPVKRNLFLAILFPRGDSAERVFEIGEDLAVFLSRLTDWKSIDEIGPGASQGLDRLFGLGLLEGS